MTVYADMIFLLNFCVDLLLLWLTMTIRKQRTPFWRLIVAALLGAVYAVMMLAPALPWFFTWTAKLLLSGLMIFIAFGFRSSPAFLRNWGVFYLVSFVVGGGMFALHYFLLEQQVIVNGILVTQAGGMGTPISWTFIVVAFPIVWWYSRLTFRSLAERQVIEQYIVQVEVVIGKNSIRGSGLIDTGNQLRDPLTRVPVMMIEAHLITPILPQTVRSAISNEDITVGLVNLSPEWLPRVKLIPYRSVRKGTEFLLAIKPDKVRITQGKQMREVNNVLIGLDNGRLSQDGTYQMIVHPSFVEGTA